MTKSTDSIGLKPRLEAAFHLQRVLGGKPFVPISSERMPDPRDRALANRLVTVSLRRHGQISHILSRVLSKGVPQRAGILEAVLRIGVAQLLFIDDIPAHSALHLAVESSRADKRAGRFDRLVNGALRSIQRDAEVFSSLPDEMLIPDWLEGRWRESYGATAVAGFAQQLLLAPPLDLTLKGADVDGLGGVRVLGSTVRLAERDATVAELPGFSDGAWWVQDISAALPARLLGAQPGQKILDLCAAPGGKTAQLAAAGAKVTALDIAPERMERVSANLERLGLDAELVTGDALEVTGAFDGVLLDAPCSATGTFRRHPEVLWHRDEKGISERVALQRKMLAHAASLVKPGGRLVYCVCSLETVEGEAQVEWAQSHLPELALDPILSDELEGWADPLRADGTVRLTPALDLPNGISGGLDGFFIARFIKKSG